MGPSSKASPSGPPCSGGGDLVVNTSQTGYQEVCTDPSYAGQVVVMTFPLIGNHGRVSGDDQSERPWLSGLVVGHATAGVLGRARQIVSLLRSAGVPAIAGLDTRRLARHLRASGSLRGVITAPGEWTRRLPSLRLGRRLRWEDQDFVSRVSADSPYEVGDDGPVVAVVDLGLKTNIIRSLRRRGARVRVLPHTAAAGQVLASDVSRRRHLAGTGRSGAARHARGPDAPRHRRRPAAAGHLPGPPDRRRGQPAPTRGACASVTTPPITPCATRAAAGSRSRRRTTRSRWSPTRCRRTPGFYVSQRNLNDGSVEGLRHHRLPIETVQYHPEGSPGPLDAAEVFDRFLGHIAARG